MGKDEPLEGMPIYIYLQPLFTWGHLPILGAARGWESKRGPWQKVPTGGQRNQQRFWRSRGAGVTKLET